MNPLELLKKAKDIVAPAPTSPKEVPEERKKAYKFVKDQGKKDKESEKK